MMRRDTISALRPDGKRANRPLGPGGRFLRLALVLSIAVHLIAALAVVYLPKILPHEARQPEEGTVELLMVEREGAKPSASAQPQAHQPAEPPPPPQEPKPQEPKPQEPADAAKAPPAPPAARPPTADGEVPPQPPAEAPAKAAKAANAPEVPQPASPPAPPKAPEAPVFDLAGTESQSNADVLGGHVVPASPDDRFRNRPPIYPYAAAAHGEHGAVTLVIHVSEAGVATGVDVVESSGVASLDLAAETAVRKWHFRPALQEGRAVPFDMPFRFIFEAE